MRVWLSRSSSALRKLPFSLELVEARPGVLACVNTSLANRLVREAIENGTALLSSFASAGAMRARCARLIIPTRNSGLHSGKLLRPERRRWLTGQRRRQGKSGS